ncbi:hypothetical protein B0I35DRAFT_509710 [Stachybotrys elegans]|uniref:CCHC-type domain-containing protein n=1 Tax=Stachybotrys elegans TaxID=80388 RepID=A0A8K0T045_9HYPO|nr:hypothetical protein B0I35DRAFT_509710 [Stachybotrys elegans]
MDLRYANFLGQAFEAFMDQRERRVAHGRGRGQGQGRGGRRGRESRRGRGGRGVRDGFGVRGGGIGRRGRAGQTGRGGGQRGHADHEGQHTDRQGILCHACGQHGHTANQCRPNGHATAREFPTSQARVLEEQRRLWAVVDRMPTGFVEEEEAEEEKEKEEGRPVQGNEGAPAQRQPEVPSGHGQAQEGEQHLTQNRQASRQA